MENSTYDFYQNTFSYIQVLKEFIPNEFNENVECAISEMYNNLLSSFSYDKILEIREVSGRLENELLKMDEKIRNEYASLLYGTYVKSMLYNYYNKNDLGVKLLFERFDGVIKNMTRYENMNNNEEELLSYHK